MGRSHHGQGEWVGRMDDGIVTLAVAALALVLEVVAVKVMGVRDDMRVMDRHFARLRNQRRRVPFDDWYAKGRPWSGRARQVIRELSAMALVLGLLVAVAPAAVAGPDCDVTIGAPANLNDRLARAGAGATVCLQADTFRTGTVKPRSNQTIIGLGEGPTIVNSGGAVNGISPKEARARDVTLVNLRVTGFIERGVLCWFGTVGRDLELDHNRQNGFGCHMDHDSYGTALINSYVHHNGLRTYTEGRRVSAGLKFTETGMPGDAPGSAVTLRGNRIVDNEGNGAWFDNASSGVLVIDNVVARNVRHEIRCEKCAGEVVIEDNDVTDSRTDRFSGIDLTSTGWAIVRGNRVDVAGGRDIYVIEEERATTTYPRFTDSGGYRIARILVTGNRGTTHGCSLDGVDCR